MPTQPTAGRSQVARRAMLGRLGLVRPGIALPAVRFASRRVLGREVGQVTTHVDGLRVRAGGPPPTAGSAS